MPDIFNFTGVGPVVIVFVGIVVVVLLAFFVASRYNVANANEALVVSGASGAEIRDERGQLIGAGGVDKGIKVVVGGGTLVIPIRNRVARLKLTARQINVSLADAVTSQGIKVAVQGVATFKIGRDVESIRNAAERFLDARDEQIDSIVKNVLEGSLRSIVGTLTVEELNLDRQKFQQAVQDAAKGDLATSGLQIDAFTIQSIADESGYMDLIGQQKQAVVERDARIAKATADQEAAVREAEAEQIKISASRDVALRRAETEMQTQAAQARASQAGPLAQAEAQQEVVRKQTELAELEAGRKAKELLAVTVRPAEAEAEALVRRAEGEKQARIAQAQAEAERLKLAGQAEAFVNVTKGEAQAKVVLVNAQAEAEKTRLEGNAEAGITFTKGEAEAKALAMRADAYKLFNDAAVIQTVLSMLPEIVRAAAEPMSNIGSLTVLSSDGASEIVRTTTRTVAEAGAAVKGLTGLDVPGLISGAMSGGLGGVLKGGDGGAGGAGGPAGTAEPARGGLSMPGGGGLQARAGRSGRGKPAEGETAPSSSMAPAEDAAAAFSRAGEAISRAGRAPAPNGGTATAPFGATPVPAPETRAAPETPAPPAASASAPAAPSTPPSIPPAPTPMPGVKVEFPSGSPASRPPSSPHVPGGLGMDTTLSEAAAQLANDLRAVPGIERFGAMRLADLDRSGPRPLRTMWRIARDRLEGRYADMTIGELLDRFESGRH